MEPSISAKEPLFPANQAFVVQFQGSVEETILLEHGRVEHLASGEATRFASLDELLRFFRQALTEAQEPPTSNPKGIPR